MSDLQLNFGNRNPAGKPGGNFATVFLFLFGTPFVGFGVLAAVQGVRKLLDGNTHDGLPLCIFGFIFSLVGFAVMFAAIWSRNKRRQTAALQARYPDKPWMLRTDWAAGRVKSSTTAQTILFLIIAVAFCSIGGIASTIAVPDALQKHQYGALLVLLFPVVGVALLVAFVNAWRSQRRFGTCFFDLAQIPIPLGEALEGMILTGKPLALEHELHLTISCIRRVVTGSGKNRSTNEYLLWQDEKVYTARADLPQPEPGHTGIPVHFKLPGDQPECHSRGNESVIWRLEARSKMSGPDFHARFEVPVFKLAGAAITTVADAPDPTATFQAPIEEIRQEEHSKIKIADGPNGREFYFPAARNIGAAVSVTLFMLVFIGIAAATYHLHAPILFPIAFGLVGILLLWGSFSLWFKSSRVTIDSTSVRTINRYLIFSRARRFDASDVSRFETKTGVQSGSQRFTDIKLVTRGGESDFEAKKEKYQQTGQTPPLQLRTSGRSGVTVATGIASVVEANWLVAEMNKALGRGHEDLSAIAVNPLRYHNQ